MSGAEVTLSSGELMSINQEEKNSGKDPKTQVTLHLQPILHGVNEDIADNGTTVLAVETQDDSKMEGEEMEYGYPITCGDSRAVLLFKKFVCPGINVRCVKFNNQLISPKQFVHLAGKATLKDWKRAIRLGGVMLRKMMDSGQIDFYQHDTVCSNTCRSTKFDVLINNTRLPPGTSVQPSLSCLALDPVGGQAPPLTGDNAEELEETVEEKFSAEWSTCPRWLLHTTAANGHPVKRKTVEIPNGILSLWKDVADSGLMGEVLSSLQMELFTTLKRIEVHSGKTNLQEEDALTLNSLCEMFGLLDSVKQAVDLKRSQSEESRIHDSVYEFDEILENQRKQSTDKTYKTSSLKQSQPQRKPQSSSHTQSSPSSVKASAVIQPHSVTGLCAASYAQLTLNPQLVAHFSDYAGQHHPGGRCGTATLESEHKISEARSPEKVHRLRQEVNKKEVSSGICKEPRRRTVNFWEDSHIRREEKDEADGLNDNEKAIIGRKASKKHKRK
ncbi:glucocorticoid modulatory element-binding protein 1-like isoform 2-T2 [Pholidichthys leucotaenia]